MGLCIGGGRSGRVWVSRRVGAGESGSFSETFNHILDLVAVSLLKNLKNKGVTHVTNQTRPQ